MQACTPAGALTGAGHVGRQLGSSAARTYRHKILRLAERAAAASRKAVRAARRFDEDAAGKPVTVDFSSVEEIITILLEDGGAAD